jgi:DNA polymerase-3 subunit epsilon
MRILFFDVETTGLLDFKAELSDPKQPHIVQLAAMLTDDEGKEIERMNVIIRPSGWEVPEEAAKIHGITTERCEAEGIWIRDALERFNGMKAQCNARVAFNISYDKRMIVREELSLGMEHTLQEGVETHCCMQMAKPLCKLPPTGKMMSAGIKSFKSPKLEEAYRHFFKKDFEGAHDAMSDVLACRDIYFAILKLKNKRKAA